MSLLLVLLGPGQASSGTSTTDAAAFYTRTSTLRGGTILRAGSTVAGGGTIPPPPVNPPPPVVTVSPTTGGTNVGTAPTMPPTVWTVYIRDHTLSRVGELTYDFGALDLTMRFNAVGSWKVTVPYDADPGSPFQLFLADFAGIEVVRDGTTIFSGTVGARNREWAEGKNRLTVSGPDDNTWIADRVVNPVPAFPFPPYTSQAYDVRYGPAAQVIRDYINANTGAFAFPGRVTGGLVVIPGAAPGPQIIGQGRWQQLDQYLQELAQGEIGWRVLQNGTQLEATVYDPVDRTAQIVFSPELGNLAAFSYSEQRPAANYVVVAGSGEGVDRVVYERQDGPSVIKWGRIETFRDRRDTADPAQLLQTGDEELARSATVTSLSLAPIDRPQMAYATHYQLGDKVTVVVDGQVIQDIVREVAITVTADDAVRVTPKVGTPDSTAPLQLFTDIRRIKAAVRDLQRS